jgi:tRNA threonylcarbamoyladenosine biosynthesis protein TsaB
MLQKLQIVACDDMYILHIETSTPVCSVALSRDRQVVAYEDMSEGMNHTAILTPAIERLMRSVGVPMTSLEAIAVGSGPGSYTGLRVGSSTAKAIAYTIGKPIIAVPTLMALGHALLEKHPEAEMALPMLDARRKEVYTALYDRAMNEIWPTSSLILEDEFFNQTISGLPRLVTGGDGATKIGSLASLAAHLVVDEDIRCSAIHLVPLAFDRLQAGNVENPLHFVPFYMKPPNITQPRARE